MAAIVPITAIPKGTSPYCTSGATNADAQNRTYVPPPYPRSPRRYDSKPMVISRATSASMEYSCTSWACRIASTELAASRAAMKAAHRLTPKRGSQKSSAATVRTLAAAGTMRTLRGELCTFCTAYKTSGYSIGEELPSRVLSRTSAIVSCRDQRAEASSSRSKAMSVMSEKRSAAAAMSKTTAAA